MNRMFRDEMKEQVERTLLGKVRQRQQLGDHSMLCSSLAQFL